LASETEAQVEPFEALAEGTDLRLIAAVPRPDGTGLAGVYTGQSDEAVVGINEVFNSPTGFVVATSGGVSCLEGFFGPEPVHIRPTRTRACPGAITSIPPVGIEPEKLAWPEKVKKHYQPEVFEAHIHEAVATCNPGVELVEVDCSEPPCMALFRIEAKDFWDRLVNQCPHWRSHYSNSVASLIGKAPCGETYLLLSPTLTRYSRATGLTEGEMMLAMRRRWQAHSDGWTCR